MAEPCKVRSTKIANAGIVAACAVVLMHSACEHPLGSCAWWFYEITVQGGCRAAVPFFFLASGMFLIRHIGETGWWLRETHKRVKTLLVPFWIWNGLYLVFCALMTVVANIVAKRGLIENMPNMLSSILSVLGLNLSWPYLGVLWFVRMLFICVVMSPVLIAAMRARCVGWAMCSLYLLLDWADVGRSNPNFLVGCFSWEGLFWFSVGLSLGQKDNLLRIKKIIEMLPSTFLLLALVCLMGLKIELLLNRIVILFPIKPFVVALILCLGYKYIPSTPWPTAIVKMTFPIYMLHTFVILSYSKTGLQPHGILGHIATFLVSIVGCVIVTGTMERIFPKTAKILFGGR